MNDLSSDARALIEASRTGDDPEARDKARVRARLVTRLGVGAFAGAAVLTVVSGAGSHPATATLAPAAARVGAAVWMKTLAAAAVVTTAGAIYAGTVPTAPPEPTPAPLDAPVLPARDPEPTVEQLVAPPEPSVTPVHAPERAEPVRRHRSSEARRRRHHARASAGETPPEAAQDVNLDSEAPAESALTAELALLARAQRALRERHARTALRLAGEYAARFPQGSLQEERAGIEVLARCMLDDAASAAAARAFLEHSPDSPLASRVRRECDRR